LKLKDRFSLELKSTTSGQDPKLTSAGLTTSRDGRDGGGGGEGGVETFLRILRGFLKDQRRQDLIKLLPTEKTKPNLNSHSTTTPNSNMADQLPPNDAKPSSHTGHNSVPTRRTSAKESPLRQQSQESRGPNSSQRKVTRPPVYRSSEPSSAQDDGPNPHTHAPPIPNLLFKRNRGAEGRSSSQWASKRSSWAQPDPSLDSSRHTIKPGGKPRRRDTSTVDSETPSLPKFQDQRESLTKSTDPKLAPSARPTPKPSSSPSSYLLGEPARLPLASSPDMAWWVK